MAQQARLHNSIVVFVFIFFWSCKQASKKYEFKFVNASSSHLKNKNGILFLDEAPFTGTAFFLFPQTKDTAQIMNFYLGKEEGVWIKFYTPKVLKEIRQFNNGIKTGIYTAWWPNGNKQLQYNFKDGEYDGTCFEWNANGLLIKEANYKAGQEEGEQKMFYDNGKTRANYVIKNGRRFGLLGTKNCVNVSDSIFIK